MPLKEMNPMPPKVLFMADYLRSGRPFSELCNMYEISRKTGCKWISRFQDSGGWMASGSRAQSTPHVIRKAVIDLRSQRLTPYGAKKIKTLLSDPQMLPMSLNFFVIYVLDSYKGPFGRPLSSPEMSEIAVYWSSWR